MLVQDSDGRVEFFLRSGFCKGTDGLHQTGEVVPLGPSAMSTTATPRHVMAHTWNRIYLVF